MSHFFETLSTVEKIYAAFALLGGFLFFLRTVLMFFGHSGDADINGDVSDLHGDADAGFKILSLQGLTSFFMMFGLVALTLSKQSGVAHVWAILWGMAAGLFTVWITGLLFLGMKKLRSDGTLRMENAMGQEGEVYLNIAPGKSGQVRVSVQGQLRVFDAVTANDVVLKTGERIRVVQVTEGNVLVVEKI